MKNIKIYNQPNLKTINLAECDFLETVDIQNNIKLENIYITGTDVSGATYTTLLGQSPLKSVNISNNPILTEFSLDNYQRTTEIKEFYANNLPQIKVIDLVGGNGNQLSYRPRIAKTQLLKLMTMLT